MGSARSGDTEGRTVGRMSLDLYTSNIPLTQKAGFIANYVSSLNGSADLHAAPEPHLKIWHSSITETIPSTFPTLRQEFGKLEDIMMNQRSGPWAPNPVLADARARIYSAGYDYCPVHTEIFGTYRNRDKRGGL